jgi:hypothetical protein
MIDGNRLTADQVNELLKFKLGQGFDRHIADDMGQSLVAHLFVEKTGSRSYRLSELGQIVVNYLNQAE